jgi:hypothetical protein
MSSVLSKRLSPDQEFQIISAIINFPIPKPAKRFSLNQVGYDTDEKITQLLIRTSMGVDELYNKLISLGYNSVNKDYIQVTESGTICVPLPTKDSKYIPIYGKFMSLA